MSVEYILRMAQTTCVSRWPLLPLSGARGRAGPSQTVKVWSWLTESRLFFSLVINPQYWLRISWWL